MNLIAAADENWGIGKNGGLLAHISGDMKYFRETTKGKIVVMGRKTLESFPGGKPLKNRVNIVLTGNKDFVPEGVVICHSVEETLEKLKEYPKEDVFIIGGGMIYKAFLRLQPFSHFTGRDTYHKLALPVKFSFLFSLFHPLTQRTFQKFPYIPWKDGLIGFFCKKASLKQV